MPGPWGKTYEAAVFIMNSHGWGNLVTDGAPNICLGPIRMKKPDWEHWFDDCYQTHLWLGKQTPGRGMPQSQWTTATKTKFEELVRSSFVPQLQAITDALQNEHSEHTVLNWPVYLVGHPEASSQKLFPRRVHPL